MGNAKFTLNAFILVLIIATAIVFFFTVALVDFANHPAINEYHPIEGTNAAVCYRSLEPSGLYEGDRANGVLSGKAIFSIPTNIPAALLGSSSARWSALI